MVSYSKYLLIGLPVLALAGLAALWWRKKERGLTYREVGRVSELFIYPVKSCKGIRVDEVKCFKEGMEFDRRWMLIDENEAFVTQRKDPKLALVTPHFEGDRYLCLDAPGMKTLKVDMQADGKEFKRLSRVHETYQELLYIDHGLLNRVWGTYAEGRYVGDEASEWFSNYLDKSGYKMYKLSKPRLISDDKTWGDVALPNDKVSFGDFAPYMIATEASLAALNEELQSPVTMKRFRPNVVVSGIKAFEEDEWADRRIKVGDVEFRYLNYCSRCTLTTVNPDTGEKKGQEPLACLRRIRLPEGRDPRYGNSPLFGVYVAPARDGVGVMRVGESVMISTYA